MCSENPKVRDSATIVHICVGSQGLSFWPTSTIQARWDPLKPPNPHLTQGWASAWIFDKYLLISQEGDPRAYITWCIFPWKVVYLNWPWQTLLPCHTPSSIQGPWFPHCFLFLSFQNMPWIVTSRDLDHLWSSGSFLAGSEAAPGELWGLPVSDLFWRVGIRIFSEDLGSGRTCALNLDQPPMTCEFGQGTVPTDLCFFTDKVYLTYSCPGFLLSPLPTLPTLHSQGPSLDREEGNMRGVRGSDREKTRWNDKNHGPLGKEHRNSHISLGASLRLKSEAFWELLHPRAFLHLSWLWRKREGYSRRAGWGKLACVMSNLCSLSLPRVDIIARN